MDRTTNRYSDNNFPAFVLGYLRGLYVNLFTMTDKEIQQQVEAIRNLTAKLLAEGKEACLKFLIDAGIIREEQIG